MRTRVTASLGAGLGAGFGVALLAGSTLNVGVRFGYWGVVYGSLTAIVVTGLLLALLTGGPRVTRAAGLVAGGALGLFALAVAWRGVTSGVSLITLRGTWLWPTFGAATVMAVTLLRVATAADRGTPAATPSRLVTALFTGAALFALAYAGLLLWEVQEHDGGGYDVGFASLPVSTLIIVVLVAATLVLATSAWRVIGPARGGPAVRDAVTNVAAAVTAGAATMALMFTTYTAQAHL